MLWPGGRALSDQPVIEGLAVLAVSRDLLIKLKQVAKLLQEGGGCGWHRPA